MQCSGQGTALKVGMSRDRFQVSPGILSVTSDSSMCPGVDSASNNGYRDNPGIKAVGV